MCYQGPNVCTLFLSGFRTTFDRDLGQLLLYIVSTFTSALYALQSRFPQSTTSPRMIRMTRTREASAYTLESIRSWVTEELQTRGERSVLYLVRLMSCFCRSLPGRRCGDHIRACVHGARLSTSGDGHPDFPGSPDHLSAESSQARGRSNPPRHCLSGGTRRGIRLLMRRAQDTQQAPRSASQHAGKTAGASGAGRTVRIILDSGALLSR
jgi:hypothetical protein